MRKQQKTNKEVADDKHLCLVREPLASTDKNSKHVLQNILDVFVILLQPGLAAS